MRTKAQIKEYMNEAFDKVWLMRTHPVESNEFTTPERAAEIEVKRQAAVERILSTYDDIPEDGYTVLDYGYWRGILGALRWVLGDEKNFLDT